MKDYNHAENQRINKYDESRQSINIRQKRSNYTENRDYEFKSPNLT